MEKIYGFDGDFMTNSDNESDDDFSDDKLRIVETPVRKRKESPKPSRTEQLIIESIEDELEKQFSEKAEKSRLNVTNVKNIIKHVVTNEHVLALIRQAEEPDKNDKSLTVYEPKLTRAKAKELLLTNPVTPVPWVTSKSTSSETIVLFSEDLQEDSSGDEYIPGEEESEDGRESSIASECDPLSVPPVTPPTPVPTEDSSTQTNWTDDGVFKIPVLKSKAEKEEEANIALRTRSKINLSSTPLEVIENAFIPPDITTDMYDMDCDDDEWADFLKGFTEPLDDLSRAAEDEDQDPEYNILADDAIDKIDKEELRMDKAVKITKKELNELWEELFEFAEIYTKDCDKQAQKNISQDQVGNEVLNHNSVLQDNLKEITETSCTVDNSAIEEGTVTSEIQNEVTTAVVDQKENKEEQELLEVPIDLDQIPLIEQQMRQHVQLLTQNFLLTYQHPELHSHSIQIKEYLLNLKYLAGGKQFSIFNTLNLLPALKLVEYWEDIFAINTEEVQKDKDHVNRVIVECLQQQKAGNYNYVPTFPYLFMDTVAKSEVFLYPTLLPRIPFKSQRFFSNSKPFFTESEDQLIALGLEQFTPIAIQADKKNINLATGEVKVKVLAAYIQEYMMPHKDINQLYLRISSGRNTRCISSNCIRYFFQNKKAPTLVHYVFPISEMLPPCKRLPNELPYLWRQFIYPNMNIRTTNPQTTNGLSYPLQPQVFNLSLNLEKPILPKTPLFTSTPVDCKKKTVGRRLGKPTFKKRTFLDYSGRFNRSVITKEKEKSSTPLSRFIECLCQPSSVHKLLNVFPIEQEAFKSGRNTDTSTKITTDRNSYRYTDNTSIVEDIIASYSYRKSHPSGLNMFPSMPSLNTPVKNYPESEINEVSSTSNTDLSFTQTAVKSDKNADNPFSKSSLFDFTAISSTSFQQPNATTEVEFCKSTTSFKTFTTSGCNINVRTEQNDQPSTSFSGCSEANSSTDKRATKDNPDDINALMKASSTVKTNVRKEPSGAEKKRTKIRREFLANLTIAAPEDPAVEKQKSEMFAMAYYDKMRETLDLEDYHKVMQILNEHEFADAVDLYMKIENILRPKYIELADEFLLFLREREAAAVGQLIPWIQMNTRSKFLRKLEIYFKDQPAQLRKIYKCLMELSQSVDVSMEKIKCTLLPMLKGNAILTDLFLQNFVNETPPPSLLEGPYETIDVNKELAKPDEELVETIVVPDIEDKYGGPSCICACHKIEDPEFKCRYRHCIPCGKRFTQGKVYIETGRGLRPATISFITNPNVDHNIRLIGKPSTRTKERKKRSDRSSSKQVLSTSPSKENVEEESEDETDAKKKNKSRAKSPRKRKKKEDSLPKEPKESQKLARAKKSQTSLNCDNLESENSSKLSAKPRKRSYSGKRSKKQEKKIELSKEEEKEEKAVEEEIEAVCIEQSEEQEQEMLTAERMDCDFNGSGESIEKANSPEPPESESEFCEESSQDNCESDSNSSISSTSNVLSQSDSNTNDEPSWKREEDKVILETFQRENDKEHAFKMISDKLKDRTIKQIRSRFQTLMTLLIEQIGSN